MRGERGVDRCSGVRMFTCVCVHAYICVWSKQYSVSIHYLRLQVLTLLCVWSVLKSKIKMWISLLTYVIYLDKSLETHIILLHIIFNSVIYLRCLSVCSSICHPACLSACLPVCLPVCLPACLPACMHACMPACHPPGCLFVCCLSDAIYISRHLYAHKLINLKWLDNSSYRAILCEYLPSKTVQTKTKWQHSTAVSI